MGCATSICKEMLSNRVNQVVPIISKEPQQPEVQPVQEVQEAQVAPVVPPRPPDTEPIKQQIPNGEDATGAPVPARATVAAGGGHGAADAADGQVEPEPVREEDLLIKVQDAGRWTLQTLKSFISELHLGMPVAIQQEPVRLIKIESVIEWQSLFVYEEVPAPSFISLSYSEVTEVTWDQTAVLSWRWGASKPTKQTHDFTPMLAAQFRELCEVLQRAKDHGLVYVWIDWCCVPQYSANSMVEVMRSKVYYGRARLMIIIPTIETLPDYGVVRQLLVKAALSLDKREHKTLQSVMASRTVYAILKRGMVAGREYFSRVWTLAERMARHGRGERLCNWLSLEAWLGMVVDAMLMSTEDKTASQIYKKILGKEAGDLLDSILAPLVDAVKTGAMMVAEGLEHMVAQLFEMAVKMWQATSILEEAPTKAWLLSYLQEAHTGIYQAWNEGDRVWAVYSYFCWKQLDQLSKEGLLEAMQDLVHVAGASRVHAASLAKKVGIDKLLDLQLVTEVEKGRLAQVKDLIAAGANVLYAKTALDVGMGVTVPAVVSVPPPSVLPPLNQATPSALVKLPPSAPDPQREGETAMHIASEKGFIEIIKELIKANANVNAARRDDSTPLYLAAKNGQHGVLQLLLDNGAEKDIVLTDGLTPLLSACRNGHLEVVEVLLRAGVDKNRCRNDGASALYLAAENNHLDILKFLLEKKVDIELRLQGGETALHIASTRGFIDIVKKLVEAGGNVDATRRDGATPLYVAAEKGKAKVLQLLLHHGAKKEVVITIGTRYTPLLIACTNNHLEVVKALLKAGTNKNQYLQMAPDLPQSGETALHIASTRGFIDIVKELVTAGANVNAERLDGATPLYVAAEKSQEAIVKYLLQKGADKDKPDKNGRRPRDIAKGGCKDLLLRW